MIIIIATENTETDTLDSLMVAYDHAQDRTQRERIAEQIHELVGVQVEAMIRYRTQNLRLDPEQVQSAGWEALLTGLDGCGQTRFQRTNAVNAEWGGIIQKCKPPTQGASDRWGNRPAAQTPVGARIWQMLPQDLQGLLAQAPPVCTRPTAERFVAGVNGLLTRRDLYDRNAWAGIPLSNEAQSLLAHAGQLGTVDLTRLNTLLIASAFPGIAVSPKPKRNLLGYISTAVIPSMLPELFEGATGKKSDSFLSDMHGALKPDIEGIRQMEAQGTLPPEWAALSEAERIYQHQKMRVSRQYGSRLKWWDEQVAKCQPQNPYRVTDRGSLQSAKELLREHGFSETLWSGPKAPNNIPTRALHPYGAQSIQRMLDSFGPQGPAIAQPALVPAPTGMPEPEQNLSWLMADGIPERAYRYVIDKIFLPRSVEHEVGCFLARNPTCTRQEGEKFVSSLPEDLAEDIRQMGGWNRIVQEVDTKILDQFRDQEARRKLMRELGAVAEIAVDRIRRIAFIRGDFDKLRRKAG